MTNVFIKDHFIEIEDVAEHVYKNRFVYILRPIAHSLGLYKTTAKVELSSVSLPVKIASELIIFESEAAHKEFWLVIKNPLAGFTTNKEAKILLSSE